MDHERRGQMIKSRTRQTFFLYSNLYFQICEIKFMKLFLMKKKGKIDFKKSIYNEEANNS
jgi:hypothetical protein